MADVLLIYTADKSTSARRLAEAISASGYQVRSEETAIPKAVGATLQESRDRTAVLLIWSRPLVASAALDDWLKAARRNPGVIEISADGILPSVGEHEGHVVSISGWRGQPFHPGWQRIRSEIERICGAAQAPSAPAPQPVAASPVAASPFAATPVAAEAPKTTERPTRAAPSGGTRKFVVASAVALALAGAAVTAVTVIGGGASDEPAAGPPAATAIAPQAVQQPTAPPASAPAAAGSVAIAAGPPSPTETADQASPPATAAPPARPQRESTAKHEPPRASVRNKAQRAAKGPLKTYSRRNSKTMRLFCERSGRSTPQCQTFLRSTRSSR